LSFGVADELQCEFLARVYLRVLKYYKMAYKYMAVEFEGEQSVEIVGTRWLCDNIEVRIMLLKYP
jgi:hypothetical protein